MGRDALLPIMGLKIWGRGKLLRLWAYGCHRIGFRSSKYLSFQGSFLGKHSNFCRWGILAKIGLMFINSLAEDSSENQKLKGLSWRCEMLLNLMHMHLWLAMLQAAKISGSSLERVPQEAMKIGRCLNYKCLAEEWRPYKISANQGLP